MRFMPFPTKSGLLALFSVLTVSSCSIPGFSIFRDNDQGASLNAGEVTNVHFFTKEVNHDTDIQLQSGAKYTLAVTILSNWMDGPIAENEQGEALDERGFDNSLMPLEFVGLTRRARENQWFELMMVQPNCRKQSLAGVNELELDDETGKYHFTASCDGKLSLFVNDTLGFYGNNIGYANIALSRVN